MLGYDPPVCLPMLTAVDTYGLGQLSGRDVDSHAALRDAAPAKRAALCDTLVCVGRFKVAVDNMLVQLERYRDTWLTQVQLLSQEREKALEAQKDLLEVSAGQLGACVALGRAAAAHGEHGHVGDAAQTAKAMEGLLAVSTRICPGTRLAVLCDLSAALACLERATRLRRFELDAARSSVSGEGLAAFVKGGAARNVIRVTCMDSDGESAGWATLQDADVGMTVNGATWQVASAVLTEPGVVEVTYVVEEGGAEEMVVGVSLRGEAVPGGPWLPHAGFMAKGVYVTTLPVREWEDNRGLAISYDRSLMVACRKINRLDVYRTEDGSHVRSFGGKGTGPGKFDLVSGLCMTALDTVLVADRGNKRIQEVTLEGVHVKFIPLRSEPHGVAVHGDLVAVCTAARAIELYSYATGALARMIPAVDNDMSKCTSFAPDGEHYVCVGRDGFLTLGWLDGQSVRKFGPRDCWYGVAFTCMGDVMGVSRAFHHVFSATDGRLLRSWVAGDSDQARIRNPSHVTVSGNQLYVYDFNRVHVFQ